MFNLIVTGNDEAWEQGEPYILDADRVVKEREYTAPEIAADLGALDAQSRQRLTELPTLFAYEGVREGRFARLGSVTRVQLNGGQVRLEYRFDENVPPIPSQIFEDLRWELEIGGWEMSRTHWAVKDADLLRILTEHGVVPAEAVGEPPLQPGEQLEQVRTDPHIRPTVFRIPAHGPEADLVAVMMPINDEFVRVYANAHIAQWIDVVLRRTLKSGGLVALIRPLAHPEAMSTKQEHGKALWKPYPFCTGRRRPTLT